MYDILWDWYINILIFITVSGIIWIPLVLIKEGIEWNKPQSEEIKKFDEEINKRVEVKKEQWRQYWIEQDAIKEIERKKRREEVKKRVKELESQMKA